ncbi:MAG: response regulator, partial [Desulforhabdus sp.]|nr:response regulator [Desulforhabdus sp.]
MKILIVEDDALLSELLREYLQKLNHETVNICSTGRAALLSVGREIYDCAFIDVMLPDMNGLQLLEQIRDENLLLPVVMMSGYPTMDFTLEAMRNGASD